MNKFFRKGINIVVTALFIWGIALIVLSGGTRDNGFLIGFGIILGTVIIMAIIALLTGVFRSVSKKSEEDNNKI